MSGAHSIGELPPQGCGCTFTKQPHAGACDWDDVPTLAVFGIDPAVPPAEPTNEEVSEFETGDRIKRFRWGGRNRAESFRTGLTVGVALGFWAFAALRALL